MTRLLTTVRSLQGREVRLTLEQGPYQDAQHYFTVTYLSKAGNAPQESRFIPCRERAEWYFREFAADRLELSLNHRPPTLQAPTTCRTEDARIRWVWERARQDWKAAGWQDPKETAAVLLPQSEDLSMAADALPAPARKPCRRHRLIAWTRACQECNPAAPISPGALSADWKRLRAGVLKRDGRRCQRCGASRKLEAHHIRPRALGGSDNLRNLMTLCYDCHNYAEPEQTFAQKEAAA